MSIQLTSSREIVILSNFGGPRSLEEIEGFLLDLMKDSHIVNLPFFLKPFQSYIAELVVKKRLSRTKEIYQRIGGKSPLVEITRIQAKLLEEKIKKKVFFLMRCGSPSIQDLNYELDVYRQKNTVLIEKITVLPLYPQYSTATTKSSFEQLKPFLSQKFPHSKIKYITSYPKHPKLIEAWCQLINLKLNQISEAQREKVLLLFSAHSVPQRYIDLGDPYLKEIKETVIEITQFFPYNKHYLSFQSRFGPAKWLEPSTTSIIESTKANERILVIPISFTSDNAETIHEIGIEMIETAKKRGVLLYRTPSLNHNKFFLECLASLAID